MGEIALPEMFIGITLRHADKVFPFTIPLTAVKVCSYEQGQENKKAYKAFYFSQECEHPAKPGEKVCIEIILRSEISTKAVEQYADLLEQSQVHRKSE